MTNNPFSNIVEQPQFLLTPLTKVNKLAIADLEKLVALQTSTLASCVDWSLGQLKAASEVSDPQSLQNFCTSQVEALNGLRQKLIDDSQNLARLGATFQSEFNKLVEESVVELVPKASQAKAHEGA